MCICAYAYHPTSLSHRVGRIHHIDRVYFEIHVPRMDLKAHFFSSDTLKYFWFLYLLSNPYKKYDCLMCSLIRWDIETPPSGVFLAHIAQSVERSPLKRMAAGSIPVVGISRCLFFSRAKSYERRYQSRQTIIIPFSILFLFLLLFVSSSFFCIFLHFFFPE